MSQSHKTITLLNSSLNGDSYKWTFGDGDSSTEKSTTHKYRVHGDYTLTYTVTNKCGSKDTSYTVVVENLSVDDVLAGTVKVYPNPTQGMLTIEFNDPIAQEAVITLFNIEGGAVQTWQLNENAELTQNINLDNVAKGTYLLHINTSEGIITKRVIKL